MVMSKKSSACHRATQASWWQVPEGGHQGSQPSLRVGKRLPLALPARGPHRHTHRDCPGCPAGTIPGGGSGGSARARFMARPEWGAGGGEEQRIGWGGCTGAASARAWPLSASWRRIRVGMRPGFPLAPETEVVLRGRSERLGCMVMAGPYGNRRSAQKRFPTRTPLT
jgi:hypothetical protein